MPALDDRAHGDSNSTREVPRLLLLIAAVLLVARVFSGVHEAFHEPTLAELVQAAISLVQAFRTDMETEESALAVVFVAAG